MDKAVAIAPEIHDICASKAIAGRPKDQDYVAAAITTKIIDRETLSNRIGMVDAAEPDARKAAMSWLISFDRKDQQR